MIVAVQNSLYVRGWSPTHQQPIVTQRLEDGKRFADLLAFERWYAKQAGSWNYGPPENFGFVAVASGEPG